MPFEPKRGASVRLIRFKADGSFPAEELARTVFESLQIRKLSRVALMVDEAVLEALPRLGSEHLEPEKDYHWSGVLAQKRFGYPHRRVLVGSYEEWFRWYMRTQRFRAFHTIILIEPLSAVSDKERGGYIDGLLVRLMAKVRRVVVVAKPARGELSAPDETRAMEVLRALLYGTRLSRPELTGLASHTFVSIPRELLDKTMERYRYHWRISKDHPRLRLDELDEELVQGMVPAIPGDYVDGKPGQIEQRFGRERRFRRELEVPDGMLAERVLQDVARRGWETVPDEAEEAAKWLGELNKAGDPRLEKVYRSQDSVSDRQWLGLLNPPTRHLRRVMDGLAAEGKLETRTWFREVGRPAAAYFQPGKAPFLEERCGQCAFYVPVRGRCRLWWLVNKKRVFFDERWKQAGSPVTLFEIHKMRYASRIGPHSSACVRFIDKKRDHTRKAVPEKCGICGEGLAQGGFATTCRNCGTRYVRFRDRVKVMTAYNHEYDRLYREVTGGDADADLEAWKQEMAGRLPRMLERGTEAEDLDMMAVGAEEQAEEPPRVWPRFNQALQEKVDRLALSTDIARHFSIAMAQNALNATRRIATFAKLDAHEAGQAVALQEKYLTIIKDAAPTSLLTYEALIMKQYWRCYDLAVKKTLQWFGPRKRSRFVREYVGDPAGRARGYSAVDAAINYLHQRRLRQAERVNAEVGFEGTCDGFLHREHYNSRGMGLLLDMIDPFKFADREVLLTVILNGGITWRDFRLEKDRRGSTFYYPADSGRTVLDRAGRDADETLVVYANRLLTLVEAYRESATSLLGFLTGGAVPSATPNPFAFITSDAQ
ncbi:MAG: CRISPR-associated endonuclease Cas1 [Nitrososphaerales archaeon]|nr:CRISPR-associated endonuclease Cas1 [Nitrososphaerales archaeon]